MASKLLGSFSIREKGVGGLRQFDGGHKLKSRLVKKKKKKNSLNGLGYCDSKYRFQPYASRKFHNFWQHHQIAGNPLEPPGTKHGSKDLPCGQC